MKAKLVSTLVLALAALSLVAEPAAAWRGRKVAFLGDSITDKQHIGCTSNYWNFLARDLGVVPLVYGINGHQMKHLLGQAQRLKTEHPDDVDAIFVFAGTNDYNANVPLGEWYTESEQLVVRNGRQVWLRRRAFVCGEDTFRGRINALMRFLRESFPAQPIYVLTPIHRGFAQFGATNVQPDETHANEIGLYIDAYVTALKEAGNVWAATVIDLNAESGLFPLAKGHARYFHDAARDMLHPNTAGHERIAAAIERHLGAAPLR